VAAEAKQQGEGKDSKVIKINCLINVFIRLEVKQAASEKADQVKETVTEVAANANETVQGKYCCLKKNIFFIYNFVLLEVKNAAEQKGSMIFSYIILNRILLFQLKK